MMYRLLSTHVYLSTPQQATDGCRGPTNPPRRLAMLCAALSTDIATREDCNRVPQKQENNS